MSIDIQPTADGEKSQKTSCAERKAFAGSREREGTRKYASPKKEFGACT